MVAMVCNRAICGVMEVLIYIIKVLNDIVGVLVLTGSAGGVQRLPINHLPLKTT
jgi:hypothetical protein